MTCLLRSLGLLAVLVLAGCYAVPQGKSELFDRLIALMADRERLWYDRKTRERFVTDQVCSWVSIDALKQMTTEVGPTLAIDHYVIDNPVVADTQPGTSRWIIRQPLKRRGGGVSQLLIDIAPDASCYALYQHIQ